MQSVNFKTARRITWITAMVAVAVAMSLPAGYFVLSQQPLPLHLAVVAFVCLLLGVAVFTGLKVLALRAVDRVLEDNTCLLEESGRRIKEQEALIAVATAASRSLRLDELLQIVLEKVLEITRRERVSIRLKNPDTGEVTLVAHRGFTQEEVETLRGMMRHQISEQVFATGKPVVINSRAESYGSQSLLPQSQSVAWVPIKSGVKVVGILAVSASQAVPFSPREVDLLQATGSVIGVAIENARLFSETDQNLEAFRILNEISQAILISQDLQTTLGKIIESTLVITSVDLGIVHLLDPKTATLEPAVSRGYRDPKSIELHRKRLSDAAVGRIFRDVMSRKAPLVEENVQRCEGLRTFKRERVAVAVMVPILADEVILGVLQVGCRAPRKFQPNEIHLLEAIGKQIGIAVQKARLYDDTQNSLQRMRTLYEIGTTINSTLDLHAILDLLMQKIDLFLPYAAVLVWLMNKETGSLERAACWNLDQKEWMGRKLKGTPPLVKAAIEEKSPVVVRDLRTDPRTLDPDFYRRNGLISYLGVPLVVQREVLGVLVFLTRQEHEFTAQEIEFLSTLSAQAAMAIHNSQLHEHAMHQAVELEKANKVKDEFLGFVSHELRTPLNAVIAYTIMMQDKLLGEINAGQGQALEKMLRYSKELLEMINSLLEVTRIQAGKVEVASHKIDLGRFLEELKSAYDAPAGKPLALNWDFASDLPSVRTDSGKLRHILQNLITNAIKYTERGSVSISARRCPGDKNVQFKVTDTGVGIPQESLPVIFEMFRQVSRPDGRSSAGVGLGLHIVKKFTEMLGGEITVESKVGKGSTFTVTIPRSPEGEEKHEAARVS